MIIYLSGVSFMLILMALISFSDPNAVDEDYITGALLFIVSSWIGLVVLIVSFKRS